MEKENIMIKTFYDAMERGDHKLIDKAINDKMFSVFMHKQGPLKIDKLNSSPFLDKSSFMDDRNETLEELFPIISYPLSLLKSPYTVSLVPFIIFYNIAKLRKYGMPLTATRKALQTFGTLTSRSSAYPYVYYRMFNDKAQILIEKAFLLSQSSLPDTPTPNEDRDQWIFDEMKHIEKNGNSSSSYEKNRIFTLLWRYLLACTRRDLLTVNPVFDELLQALGKKEVYIMEDHFDAVSDDPIPYSILLQTDDRVEPDWQTILDSVKGITVYDHPIVVKPSSSSSNKWALSKLLMAVIDNIFLSFHDPSANIEPLILSLKKLILMSLADDDASQVDDTNLLIAIVRTLVPSSDIGMVDDDTPDPIFGKSKDTLTKDDKDKEYKALWTLVYRSRPVQRPFGYPMNETKIHPVFFQLLLSLYQKTQGYDPVNEFTQIPFASPDPLPSHEMLSQTIQKSHTQQVLTLDDWRSVYELVKDHDVNNAFSSPSKGKKWILSNLLVLTLKYILWRQTNPPIMIPTMIPSLTRFCQFCTHFPDINPDITNLFTIILNILLAETQPVVTTVTTVIDRFEASWVNTIIFDDDDPTILSEKRKDESYRLMLVLTYLAIKPVPVHAADTRSFPPPPQTASPIQTLPLPELEMTSFCSVGLKTTMVQPHPPPSQWTFQVIPEGDDPLLTPETNDENASFPVVVVVPNPKQWAEFISPKLSIDLLTHPILLEPSSQGSSVWRHASSIIQAISNNLTRLQAKSYKISNTLPSLMWLRDFSDSSTLQLPEETKTAVMRFLNGWISVVHHPPPPLAPAVMAFPSDDPSWDWVRAVMDDSSRADEVYRLLWSILYLSTLRDLQQKRITVLSDLVDGIRNAGAATILPSISVFSGDRDPLPRSTELKYELIREGNEVTHILSKDYWEEDLKWKQIRNNPIPNIINFDFSDGLGTWRSSELVKEILANLVFLKQENGSMVNTIQALTRLRNFCQSDTVRLSEKRPSTNEAVTDFLNEILLIFDEKQSSSHNQRVERFPDDGPLAWVNDVLFYPRLRRPSTPPPPPPLLKNTELNKSYILLWILLYFSTCDDISLLPEEVRQQPRPQYFPPEPAVVSPSANSDTRVSPPETVVVSPPPANSDTRIPIGTNNPLARREIAMELKSPSAMFTIRYLQRMFAAKQRRGVLKRMNRLLRSVYYRVLSPPEIRQLPLVIEEVVSNAPRENTTPQTGLAAMLSNIKKRVAPYWGTAFETLLCVSAVAAVGYSFSLQVPPLGTPVTSLVVIPRIPTGSTTPPLSPFSFGQTSLLDTLFLPPSLGEPPGGPLLALPAPVPTADQPSSSTALVPLPTPPPTPPPTAISPDPFRETTHAFGVPPTMTTASVGVSIPPSEVPYRLGIVPVSLAATLVIIVAGLVNFFHFFQQASKTDTLLHTPLPIMNAVTSVGTPVDTGTRDTDQPLSPFLGPGYTMKRDRGGDEDDEEDDTSVGSDPSPMEIIDDLIDTIHARHIQVARLVKLIDDKRGNRADAIPTIKKILNLSSEVRVKIETLRKDPDQLKNPADLNDADHLVSIYQTIHDRLIEFINSSEDWQPSRISDIQNAVKTHLDKIKDSKFKDYAEEAILLITSPPPLTVDVAVTILDNLEQIFTTIYSKGDDDTLTHQEWSEMDVSFRIRMQTEMIAGSSPYSDSFKRLCSMATVMYQQIENLTLIRSPFWRKVQDITPEGIIEKSKAIAKNFDTMLNAALEELISVFYYDLGYIISDRVTVIVETASKKMNGYTRSIIESSSGSDAEPIDASQMSAPDEEPFKFVEDDDDGTDSEPIDASPSGSGSDTGGDDYDKEDEDEDDDDDDAKQSETQQPSSRRQPTETPLAASSGALARSSRVKTGMGDVPAGAPTGTGLSSRPSVYVSSPPSQPLAKRVSAPERASDFRSGAGGVEYPAVSTRTGSGGDGGGGGDGDAKRQKPLLLQEIFQSLSADVTAYENSSSSPEDLLSIVASFFTKNGSFYKQIFEINDAYVENLADLQAVRLLHEAAVRMFQKIDYELIVMDSLARKEIPEDFTIDSVNNVISSALRTATSVYSNFQKLEQSESLVSQRCKRLFDDIIYVKLLDNRLSGLKNDAERKIKMLNKEYNDNTQVIETTFTTFWGNEPVSPGFRSVRSTAVRQMKVEIEELRREYLTSFSDPRVFTAYELFVESANQMLEIDAKIRNQTAIESDPNSTLPQRVADLDRVLRSNIRKLVAPEEYNPADLPTVPIFIEIMTTGLLDALDQFIEKRRVAELLVTEVYDKGLKVILDGHRGGYRDETLTSNVSEFTLTAIHGLLSKQKGSPNSQFMEVCFNFGHWCFNFVELIHFYHALKGGARDLTEEMIRERKEKLKFFERKVLDFVGSQPPSDALLKKMKEIISQNQSEINELYKFLDHYKHTKDEPLPSLGSRATYIPDYVTEDVPGGVPVPPPASEEDDERLGEPPPPVGRPSSVPLFSVRASPTRVIRRASPRKRGPSKTRRVSPVRFPRASPKRRASPTKRRASPSKKKSRSPKSRSPPKRSPRKSRCTSAQLRNGTCVKDEKTFIRVPIIRFPRQRRTNSD